MAMTASTTLQLYDRNVWTLIPSGILAVVGVTTLWRSLLRSARVRLVDVSPSMFTGWIPERGEPILRLRFALVFTNPGAKTGTVSDLMMRCPRDWCGNIVDDPLAMAVAAWDGMGAKALEAGFDKDVYAYPFPVNAGETRALICRFRIHVDPWRVLDSACGNDHAARPQPVEVWMRVPTKAWRQKAWLRRLSKARSDDNDGWRCAQKFDLYLSTPFFKTWNDRGWSSPHWNTPSGKHPAVESPPKSPIPDEGAV